MKDPVRRKIDRYGLTRTINPDHFFPSSTPPSPPSVKNREPSGRRRHPRIPPDTGRRCQRDGRRPHRIERWTSATATSAQAQEIDGFGATGLSVDGLDRSPPVANVPAPRVEIPCRPRRSMVDARCIVHPGWALHRTGGDACWPS
jgi:hypothetical protein